MVKQVTSDDEFKAALKAGPVFVDFYATWCGPCKMIAPKLEAMEKEYPGITFIKVDVDELEDLAQEMQISAMPTFIIFKNGEKVDTLMGASEQKVRELLEKHK